MCGNKRWKTNLQPTYKFDLVDIKQFRRRDFWTYTKYTYMHCLVIKASVVLFFDIFSVANMFFSRSYTNRIFEECREKGTQGDVAREDHGCVPVSYKFGKWIFLGCLLLSIVLLALDILKAKAILRSGDIAFSYINIMTRRFLSMRSYDVFCLFDRINTQEKNIDAIALFIFFTFKGWKQVLLANLPRQVINAFALVAFYRSRMDDGPLFDLDKYTRGDFILGVVLVMTATTVLLCAWDVGKLLVAGFLYLCMAFHIDWKLKEYCNYRVEKRVANVIPVWDRWTVPSHGSEALSRRTPTVAVPDLNADGLQSYTTMPMAYSLETTSIITTPGRDVLHRGRLPTA